MERTVVSKLSQLIRVKLFGGVAAVSPKTAAVTRVLRGLREGDQQALLTGAALFAYNAWRNRGPERELIARREVPLGSTVVIRHGKKGELPQIQFYESGD
jgi:hypothetical protein